MKNVAEDKMLNELALAYANGDSFAGEEFMSLVFPKVKRYARKLHREFHEIELDDLIQEFMLVAIKMCKKYAERYNDGKTNIMPLIYRGCKNRQIDIARNDSAEMRASKITVGDEVINRKVSLSAPIGEDGESELSDTIALEQVSVEETVENNHTREVLEKVVIEFVRNTKGRHGKILPLMYLAQIEDWDTDYLNDRVAEVLREETGKEPKNDAIRQAKSRAMKAFRDAIEKGKLVSAREL